MVSNPFLFPSPSFSLPLPFPSSLSLLSSLPLSFICRGGVGWFRDSAETLSVAISRRKQLRGMRNLSLGV